MNQLYQGDCLDVLRTLPDGSVDAVVTDPPYGIKYRTGKVTGGKWANVRHHGVTIANDDRAFDPAHLLALNVPLICWGANHYSDRLPGGGWLVWDKWHGIKEMDWSRSDAELAYFSGSRLVKTFRHLWHGLCRDTEVGQHLHPTQKPVALMRWCIGLLKLPPGSTILDPYMGSGTTGVACWQLGYNFIGIELDPGHFATAKRRIAAERAKTALFHEETA